jgi:hypothetical protein
MRTQSQEERSHTMKMFGFIVDQKVGAGSWFQFHDPTTSCKRLASSHWQPVEAVLADSFAINHSSSISLAYSEHPQ